MDEQKASEVIDYQHIAPGYTVIRGVKFISLSRGVLIIYPNPKNPKKPERRIINNSFYDDINTDCL